MTFLVKNLQTKSAREETVLLEAHLFVLHLTLDSATDFLTTSLSTQTISSDTNFAGLSLWERYITTFVFLNTKHPNFGLQMIIL